jgi:hypothetical protein
MFPPKEKCSKKLTILLLPPSYTVTFAVIDLRYLPDCQFDTLIKADNR